MPLSKDVADRVNHLFPVHVTLQMAAAQAALLATFERTQLNAQTVGYALDVHVIGHQCFYEKQILTIISEFIKSTSSLISDCPVSQALAHLAEVIDEFVAASQEHNDKLKIIIARELVRTKVHIQLRDNLLLASQTSV